MGIQPSNFVNAPALDVVDAPILYKPFGFDKIYAPDMLDYSYLTFFAGKVLPITAANYQIHESINYFPDEEDFNLNTEDGWKKLLSDITNIQNAEDPFSK